MKKTLILGLLISVISLSTFIGCSTSSNDTALPTTATIKIMANGTIDAGVLIGGINVKLTLPAGVTVKATADPTNDAVMVTDPGVVTASGVAAGANTIATATSASGVVAIHVANADGFATGEFVTVNCDIAATSVPTAASFGVSGFQAVDLNGAAITGLIVGVTAAIQ